MSNTIFAVVCSSCPSISDAKLFSTKEKAMSYMQVVARDRRHKMGVVVTTDTPEVFSYILGWEEIKVTFSVAEFPIE